MFKLFKVLIINIIYIIMLCKYCKSTDHVIDDCTEIICKNCKKYGHVHWKCTYNTNSDVRIIRKKNKKDKKDNKKNYNENFIKRDKKNDRDKEYLINKRLKRFISNLFEVYDLGGTIPLEMSIWTCETETNDWPVEEMTKWGLTIEKLLTDLKKNLLT